MHTSGRASEGQVHNHHEHVQLASRIGCWRWFRVVGYHCAHVQPVRALSIAVTLRASCHALNQPLCMLPSVSVRASCSHAMFRASLRRACVAVLLLGLAVSLLSLLSSARVEALIVTPPALPVYPYGVQPSSLYWINPVSYTHLTLPTKRIV